MWMLKRKKWLTERETQGHQKDTERKLCENFVALTHRESSVLCSREITEKESEGGREEERPSRWT